MVQYQGLDRTFGALADSTRRSILDRLARGPATISELAEPFGMSLSGLKKHVHILEAAGLVTSEKKGRIRECRLGPSQLDEAIQWIDWYRAQWNHRLDRLEKYMDENRRRRP